MTTPGGLSNDRLTKGLVPFRYRDPLRGKWMKARYVAERHEITARYHA